MAHKITQIAAGRNHSLALASRGDVYACGNGKEGQLGLPDKEMRKIFTHVLSLMSVNAIKLYAGGLHSWIVLDEVRNVLILTYIQVMPKKDEFQALKGLGGADGEDDSLLNSPRDDETNFNSNFEMGGADNHGHTKSEASNWNFFRDTKTSQPKFMI